MLAGTSGTFVLLHFLLFALFSMQYKSNHQFIFIGGLVFRPSKFPVPFLSA